MKEVERCCKCDILLENIKKSDMYELMCYDCGEEHDRHIMETFNRGWDKR